MWNECYIIFERKKTFPHLHIHLPLVELSTEKMQIQAAELHWLQNTHIMKF